MGNIMSLITHNIEQAAKTAQHESNKRGKELLQACYTGNFDEVRRLVPSSSSSGANVNCRDQDGVTPVIKCCYFRGQPEILRYLLENGANGSIPDNVNGGRSPLQIAVHHNSHR
jgi:ankyrin repeat protein